MGTIPGMGTDVKDRLSGSAIFWVRRGGDVEVMPAGLTDEHSEAIMRQVDRWAIQRVSELVAEARRSAA